MLYNVKEKKHFLNHKLKGPIWRKNYNKASNGQAIVVFKPTL